MTAALQQRLRGFSLAVLAMLLAAATTGAAWLLVRLIQVITNLAFYQRWSAHETSPAGNALGLIVVLVPVAGALIIGLMARFGSRAIRGHGIPEAMEQVLTNESRVPARIVLLKPLSAAISIGTGGPFGAEGPIISTGGALGSLFGQVLSVSSVERKTLLAAGAAAGMTAIFGSPVAAVLLAVELLLFEYSMRSLAPVALACATAAALRQPLFGAAPVFAMPAVAAPGAWCMPGFILLGAVAGAAAAGVSRAVYWVEDQFEKLPLHWMWWPAVGAVAVGIIGWAAPRTLGVGYDNIQDILAGALPLSAVAWLCGMKLLSWLIALGSGTSGGTLAPLLTIGAGLGLLLAAAARACGLDLPPHLAALVGMTAMFAGASRALLASVVFAFETTRQPEALPVLLGGGTAALLASGFFSVHSIMTEKITRRGVRVPHSYLPHPLLGRTVQEVMSADYLTAPDTWTAADLARVLAAGASARRQACLLLDTAGRLTGIITRSDLLKSPLPETPLRALAAPALHTIHPQASVQAALSLMMQKNIGRLPVVDPAQPGRVLGYLGRAEVLAAHLPDEDAMRQQGWLSRWLSRHPRPPAP